MRTVFRVYTAPDILTVELGRVLKKEAALAAGTVSGLDLETIHVQLCSPEESRRLPGLERRLGHRWKRFKDFPDLGIWTYPVVAFAAEIDKSAIWTVGADQWKKLWLRDKWLWKVFIPQELQVYMRRI